MSNLKPKRRTWESIREKAESVRKKYVIPINQIPVPIEKIIEFRIGLEIEPKFGLRELASVEAILLRNSEKIYIDNTLYKNPAYEKRNRFTLAHELGHYFLHKEDMEAYHFDSIDEWISFRSEIDEDDLDWFEKQANEFAGRFLVPIEPLNDLLLRKKEQIKDFYIKHRDDDADHYVLTGLSRILSDDFMVSPDVIKKRIKTEFDWNSLRYQLTH